MTPDLRQVGQIRKRRIRGAAATGNSTERGERQRTVSQGTQDRSEVQAASKQAKVVSKVVCVAAGAGDDTDQSERG